MARKMPISRVRSKTDMAMVLAMPRMPISRAMEDVPQATAWARVTNWLLAGALGGELGIQAGQCGFNLPGRASDMCLRFAGWRRAQPHMKAGDLALQAGELLHLIERHDDGTGFERRAAVIDPDNRKR
jgi:hypothetical protein